MEEFLTSHSEVNKDDIAKLEREIASTLDMKAKSRPTTSLDQAETMGNGNRGDSRGDNNNQVNFSSYLHTKNRNQADRTFPQFSPFAHRTIQ